MRKPLSQTAQEMREGRVRGRRLAQAGDLGKGQISWNTWDLEMASHLLEGTRLKWVARDAGE